MLEALDHIDWKSLGHAYGAAEDVPQQIRDLRSNEKEKRDKASWELFGNIFHQGSRFEASAYAVPFLVQVAVAPDTQDREIVLSLLGALAVGYDEAWLPGGVDIDAWRSDVAVLDGEEAEWEAWVLNAYDAVRESLPAMRPLLEDANATIRMWAAYVLAWFPEDASNSLPVLRKQVKHEGNGGAAAAAIVAIGLLGDSGNDELVEWLQHEVASETRSRRWAAATALARLTPAELPPTAVDELRLTSSGDEPDLDGERFPFFEGDLPGYAAATLASLPAAVGEGAIDELLARLSHVSSTEALNAGRALLKIAFPDGPVPAGTPFAELSGLQQHVVRGLADAPDAWMVGDAILANFSSLVSYYGLPADLDGIRTYATR